MSLSTFYYGAVTCKRISHEGSTPVLAIAQYRYPNRGSLEGYVPVGMNNQREYRYCDLLNPLKFLKPDILQLGEEPQNETFSPERRRKKQIQRFREIPNQVRNKDIQ